MRETVTIQYPVRYATHEVTKAEYNLVLELNLRLKDRVQAIKFIRAQYGLGLKEAKDICDQIILSGPWREEESGTAY